jgi:hypothetical protein
MTLPRLEDRKAAGSDAVNDTKHITYDKTIIYAVRVVHYIRRINSHHGLFSWRLPFSSGRAGKAS